LEIGLLLSLSTIIAGIFDAVENVNLLLMLNDTAYISTLSPFFASLCASFKIGFLGAGLGFLYILFMILIFRRINIQKFYLYLAFIGGGLLNFWLLSIWSLYISVLIGVIYFVMLGCICYRLKNEIP